MAKGLSEIVGNNNILDSEKILQEYSRDQSFAPKIRPRSIVKLQSRNQVADLIKWANETATPLVPVSSGSPHFNGDTVPSVGGTIILDLSGLNNVIRVDRKNRVVMIEPGVTFGELIPRVTRAGIKLNLPLLPRSNKSVIGSMLERQPVIMPLYQWDAMDPLTCVEVVFGSGDVFRTGSASGPGTLEEQWKTKQAQVRPMGPGATDFGRLLQGAQGTLGIVTWATVKCEYLPDLQKPFIIGSDEYEKLADFAYRMLWYKSGDECFILNNTDFASIFSQTLQEYEKVKAALPAWLLFFALSGYKYYPEEKIAYQESILGEEAKKSGLQLSNVMSGISADRILKSVSRPSAEPYWQERCQDLFFLTTLDRVERFVKIMYAVADKNALPDADIGIYVQPMVQGTSCHCEFDIFYNHEDAAQSAKAKKVYEEASIALLNAGAYFSRPYGALADIAYQKDAEMTAALRKVKGIFDPNNILNVGKLCF